MRHIARWFFKITGYFSAIIYFFPKVYYENKLIQSRRIKKGALIVTNHKSPLDFVFSMLLFMTRSIHCIVSETIYDGNALLRFVFKCLGSIKVNRFNLDMSFMYEAKKVIDRGGVVQIFPEGTFVKTEEFKEFKVSFIYLAMQTDAPIIPVYLKGNYGLFKRARAVIGKSINVFDYLPNDNPSIDEIKAVAVIISNKLSELKQMI